jgi:D-alanyl-D-alanine carboxypeptidase
MRARPILPVLLAGAATLVAAPARPAATATVGGPRVASRHAILVDADGGAVLWARLGLRHSRWRNPHGLDAPGHRSSAFDLAVLARAVLRDPWLARVVLDSPDTAADAGQLLDWGFGRGRAARTGLRLPAYVAPASVTTLLVRPPTVLQRHRPRGPGAAAVGAAGGTPGQGGPADRRGWRAGSRAAAGAGATAALLAAGLALWRRRREPA